MKVFQHGEQQSGDSRNSREPYFMSDSPAEMNVELKQKNKLNPRRLNCFPRV